MKTHHYISTTAWTGNTGAGTSDYRAFSRDHRIIIPGKADLLGSSDPAFLGDPSRHNPEELLLASLSSCHMLWYLHLCATNGIVVTAYTDEAKGQMVEEADGSGHFTSVILHPVVTITDASKAELANALHHKANKMCFIANSCNFPVTHIPTCNF